jgi:hypothetical protein
MFLHLRQKDAIEVSRIDFTPGRDHYTVLGVKDFEIDWHLFPAEACDVHRSGCNSNSGISGWLLQGAQSSIGRPIFLRRQVAYGSVQ